jgi:hypothetical protein
MTKKKSTENFSELIYPFNHSFITYSSFDKDERNLAEEAESSKVYHKPLQRLPLTFIVKFRNRPTEEPITLTLLINPSSMSSTYSKTINESFTSRKVVVEDWGDNQLVLNFNGSIGGYVVLNPTVGSSGLNRYDRARSASFTNLMDLLMLFRNNGMLFQQTVKRPTINSRRLIGEIAYNQQNKTVNTINENIQNKIFEKGEVYLLFDDKMYLGSFEEFAIEEDAEKPFNLNYNFTFIVQNTIQLNNRGFQQPYNQSNSVFSDVDNYFTNFDSGVLAGAASTVRDFSKNVIQTVNEFINRGNS